MPKFFGRNVNYDGCEAVFKLGSKYPDPNDWRHTKRLRDGQLCKIMPLGYHTGRRLGYSLALVKFPNISYRRIGGPTYNEWSTFNRNREKWIKLTEPKDKYGKYPWEWKTIHKEDIRNREHDYFVDFHELFLKNYLTQGEYENLYDFSHKSEPIIIPESSFDELFHHEDGDHQRLNLEHDTQHASVTSGTYDIGSGQDYDDLNDAITDIGTPLTGNLTFEHAAEETAFTSSTVDTETDGSLLTFTAASGAECTGEAYEDQTGARVNFGTAHIWRFDETTDGHLDDVTVSKLAIDASGTINQAILFDDGGNSGLLRLERCLVKGDSASAQGGTGLVQMSNSCQNGEIRNCIIYGASKTDVAGIEINAYYTSPYTNQALYNNTVVKCYNNIRQDHTVQGSSVIILKNNLCQDDQGGADYVDDGAGFGTTEKNYGENDSPDSLTDNFHDGTSNFIDYTNDDYRIDSGGDAINTLKAGADLTGIFTDDINGDTRTSGEFFIGADWIDTGGGPSGVTRFGGLYGKALSGSLGGRGV